MCRPSSSGRVEKSLADRTKEVDLVAPKVVAWLAVPSSSTCWTRGETGTRFGSLSAISQSEKIEGL